MSDADPTPDRRIWYRHARTGDRGFLVRRMGADHIRYDRGDPLQTVPFRSDEWTEDTQKRRLHDHEVAQVAHAADRRLCRALGLAREANRDWLDIPEAERIRYVTEGPDAPEGSTRARLFRLITEALRDDSAGT